jgi:hypothetical protein
LNRRMEKWWLRQLLEWRNFWKERIWSFCNCWRGEVKGNVIEILNETIENKVKKVKKRVTFEEVVLFESLNGLWFEEKNKKSWVRKQRKIMRNKWEEEVVRTCFWECLQTGLLNGIDRIWCKHVKLLRKFENSLRFWQSIVAIWGIRSKSYLNGREIDRVVSKLRLADLTNVSRLGWYGQVCSEIEIHQEATCGLISILLIRLPSSNMHRAHSKLRQIWSSIRVIGQATVE